ncbi:MAG: outer membrane beta-barrel protein [Bacteroidetes bacterium]|nr:outer membrane beta-barrel protein [Bacteroidota bacterium]
MSSLSHISFGQSSIGLRIFSPQFSNFTDRIGVYQSPQNAAYTQGNLTGLLLGVTGRINLKGRHYLHTELLYSMRGERYKYNVYTLNGYTISTMSGGKSSIEYYLDYRTHYIEIPVMYCIDLTHDAGNDSPIHVYFSSGLSVGINVVSKLKQNSFSITSPGSTFSAIDEHTSESQVSQTNPLILNFVTDLDIEFRRRKTTKVFAYGRFNQSLTNVFNHQYNDMKTKLVTYGFGFGLRWYLKS